MRRTVHEGILSYMKLSENESQVGYPMLKEAADISWYKVFKKTRESIVRKWVEVICGEIRYPCSMEKLLGVYTVDSCGDLVALFEDSHKNTLPKPAEKCTCNICDHADCMCPSVQDGIVQTDVVIEGQTYTNKVHTRVLKNGNVVEQSFTWVPSYNLNNTVKEVVEVPHEKTICKVDVLPCGCLVASPENAALLFNCGCVVDCEVPYLRERYPALYNDIGYYKHEPEYQKIFLFSNTGKKSRIKQVMLVFQSAGEDMLIPEYANMAFLAMLDWTRKMYSPSFGPQDRNEAKRNFKREEMEMIKHLNPIPYNWISEADEAKPLYQPYYRGVHSDFIHPAPAYGITGAAGTGGIGGTTNNYYYSGTVKLPFIGEVDAGSDHDPVSTLTTFQHNDLIGLGKQSGGKVKIEVDDNTMASYGQNKTFDFDTVTGTITFTPESGYSWQPRSSLWINLNQ